MRHRVHIFLLLILLCASFCPPAAADSLQWIYSYEDALKLAVSEDLHGAHHHPVQRDPRGPRQQAVSLAVGSKAPLVYPAQGENLYSGALRQPVSRLHLGKVRNVQFLRRVIDRDGRGEVEASALAAGGPEEKPEGSVGIINIDLVILAVHDVHPAQRIRRHTSRQGEFTVAGPQFEEQGKILAVNLDIPPARVTDENPAPAVDGDAQRLHQLLLLLGREVLHGEPQLVRLGRLLLAPAAAVVGRVETGAAKVNRHRVEDRLDRGGAAFRAGFGSRLGDALEELEDVPVRTLVFVRRHGNERR